MEVSAEGAAINCFCLTHFVRPSLATVNFPGSSTPLGAVWPTRQKKNKPWCIHKLPFRPIWMWVTGETDYVYFRHCPGTAPENGLYMSDALWAHALVKILMFWLCRTTWEEGLLQSQQLYMLFTSFPLKLSQCFIFVQTEFKITTWERCPVDCITLAHLARQSRLFGIKHFGRCQNPYYFLFHTLASGKCLKRPVRLFKWYLKLLGC